MRAIFLSRGRPDPDQTDGARDGFPPCFKNKIPTVLFTRWAIYEVSLLGTACLPWHYARPDASKMGELAKDKQHE